MASDYLVIDDFLPDWHLLREFLVAHSRFDDETGKDGVVYPGICKDLGPFEDYIFESIKPFGANKVNFAFARLSTEGSPVPHQVHSDAEWGDWSLMLYMNLLEDCEGGTSFLRHKTGFSVHPVNQKQVEHWKKDHNSPEAWTITDMVEMMPNRAVIFPAKKMHRAEPVGGFGSNTQNGRLVVTVFFS